PRAMRRARPACARARRANVRAARGGAAPVPSAARACRAHPSLFLCALARREVLDFLVLRRLGGSDRTQGGDPGLLADLLLDLARERGVLLEEVASVVLALSQPVAVVDVPGARLLEHAEVD